MEIGEMIIRLVLIVILAFFLGLEREIKNQPAGLRTHILIGLGSTLIMIISIMMPELYESPIGDPSRIAAQVVSGIGFIGAGVIMKMGLNTKGLTTAANIWVTSAIGLSVGAGMYTIAILATILVLLNLILITKVKNKYLKQTNYCNIKIDFKKKEASHTTLIKTLNKLPIDIISKEITENDKKISIEILAKIHKNKDIYQIHRELRYSDNLAKVSVSENIR